MEEEQWAEKKAIITLYMDNPATTGGRDRLWGHIRENHPQISRRDVARALAEDADYQIHRPLRKRVTTRPIIVSGPAKVAQVDLIDMQKFAGHNAQKRYILTYVDLFSKYADARALPNKTQAKVVEALMDILDSMPASWRPSTIQADNGSEFQTQMEAALKRRGIKTVHSQPYNPRSQGAIERFNRTLKTAMFQLMTRADSKRWIDYLPDLLANFNNAVHGTTGYKPSELMHSIPLEPHIIQHIQQKMRKRIVETTADEMFQVGDYVRVALTTEAAIRRQTFRKQIAANWSPTVYQIYSISQPETAGTQPQYLLKNLSTNRKSAKRYWGYQLSKTQAPSESEKPAEPESEHSVAEESDEEEEVPVAPAPPRRTQRVWQPSQQALRNFALD